MRTSVEIERLSHAYRRHGGKKNRRLQVERMKVVCAWVDENHNVGTIHRIGRKHIIDFYRHHRHLSQATLERGYYYSLCELWSWLHRPGKPPKPLMETKHD